MANTTASPEPVPNSGVLITGVRVFNFRCLRAVEASLGPTTLLVGENNAGKTSFLEAIYAAIGNGQRQFTEEDIWTELKEKQAPHDRSIIVDLLLRPVNAKGKVIDNFPEGSPWLELWGVGIVLDDDDHDILAIRAKFAWSAIKGEYVSERKFLKEWAPTLAQAPDVPFLEKVGSLTILQLTPISLFLLDAKRDGAEDIRSRGSVWHKMVSDPGLNDGDIDQIEQKLTEINEIFVTQSSVLTHVQGHLSSVADVVNCDKDGVAITPVARRLRDLHKGMDVLLSTSGASAFPLSKQGMGTRSLASVLLFRAYMSWKMSSRKTEALHPFLAIEEPESHLHPHAQRALFGQIEQIPGQRIISTHSPYICAQADIRTFLRFGKIGNETKIQRFDSAVDNLTPEDLRRINREVMNTRGDLLFSRHIVLFEGETEEQSLPQFAHQHWGCHPNELGVSFVGVGGKDAYTPFLRLAHRFSIPWCIFSDGAPADIKSVNNCLKKAGFPEGVNVFTIPGGHDYEGHLAHPEYLPLLCDMIVAFETDRAKLDPRSQEELKKKLMKKTPIAIADDLRREKTAYGGRIAKALSLHTDEKKRVPPFVQIMLDAVRPIPAVLPLPTTEVGNGD